MKQRLWIPDWLKGLAVLFMVQDHILETWINQDFLLTPAGAVIRMINNFPAAAIFMLLMGYLAGYGNTAPGRMIGRGFKVFFWGFLLNVGLNFHYLIKLINGSLQGNPWQALFAVDILYLAGLSLIILGLIRYLPKPQWWSVGLSIVILSIAPFLTSLFQPSGNAMDFLWSYLAMPTQWSFFPLFPWLAYPLVAYGFSGFLSNIKLNRIPHWLLIVFLLILSIPASLGFVNNWNDLIDLPSYYHHGWPVFLWIISFTGALALLLYLIPAMSRGVFSAWLQFTGKNLTRFYVIQWLLIGNLATFFYQELNFGAFFVGTVLITLATFIIVYAIRNLKFPI